MLRFVIDNYKLPPPIHIYKICTLDFDDKTFAG